MFDVVCKCDIALLAIPVFVKFNDSVDGLGGWVAICPVRPIYENPCFVRVGIMGSLSDVGVAVSHCLGLLSLAVLEEASSGWV